MSLNTAYKARKRRASLGMDAATQMKPGEGAKPGMNVLPKADAKPARPRVAQQQSALANFARRTAPTTKAPSPFKPRRKRAK